MELMGLRKATYAVILERNIVNLLSTAFVLFD